MNADPSTLNDPTPAPAWGRLALLLAILVAIILIKTPFESRLGEGDRELILRMGIVALMAASLALVNGAAGQFSLGHAAFQGVGAYTTAAIFALVYSNASGLFTTPNPLADRNPWLVAIGARGAILLGGVAAAMVGFLVALPCLRLRGDYLAIVTLGFNEIVGVVIRSLGKVGRVDLRGNLGFNAIPRHIAGGFLDVYLTLVIALIVLYRLVHGGRGLAFAAVKQDEIAAEAVGVNTTRTKVAAFVASSFIAGLAGGLLAFKMGTINDRAFDMAHSFDYVVMVILGGNGNLIGAALAGAGLTFLNDRLRSFESWRMVVYSFALVWIMVSRSQGLLKKLAERVTRRAEPVDREAAREVETSDRTDDLELLASGGRHMNGPVLELRGLSVRFGGLVAVEGLDLDVAPGECVGLIGPNGAGKSTVFNAITGIYPASSGHILVGGVAVEGQRPNKIVKLGAARTFQNIRLFRDLSALDNVRVPSVALQGGGLIAGILPTKAIRTAADRSRLLAEGWLRVVGLANQGARKAGSLPYGSQRRLEIARAMATSPRLLLLDEPAAGLNPTEKGELIVLLRSILTNHGISILLVEHDMGLVMELCSKIVVLDYGRKIAEGTPELIRSNPQVIEAYLGPEEGDAA
ncbi:MAG: Lipopolysaccharide export system ATP-binding protein LptB [Planctomycetota bacterium]|nr:Lipopolysaccharide export system ATP-binding protein LptB [Planctomycetota bacterium]